MHNTSTALRYRYLLSLFWNPRYQSTTSTPCHCSRMCSCPSIHASPPSWCSLSLLMLFTLFYSLYMFQRRKYQLHMRICPLTKLQFLFPLLWNLKKSDFKRREFWEANSFLVLTFLFLLGKRGGLFLFFSLLSVLVNVGHVWHKWLNLILNLDCLEESWSHSYF